MLILKVVEKMLPLKMKKLRHLSAIKLEVAG